MIEEVSPPIEEWGGLRPRLTEGEERLARFLITELEHVEGAWSVYVQPRINTVHPDVVVFHPEYGVTTFEVKDWNPAARALRREGKKLIALSADGTSYVTDNAVDQADRAQTSLLSMYTRARTIPGSERDRHAMVAARVFLTNYSTVEARRLLGPLVASRLKDTTAMRPFFQILGGDQLEHGRIHEFVPAVEPRYRVRVPKEVSIQLRALLREPEVTARQRLPLPLDDQKMRLLGSRAHRRRVQGTAGSGKSTFLAAQAARWALDGKKVLFLGFNITLWHHFRDLAVRYGVSRSSVDDLTAVRTIQANCTFTYLHDWAADTIARGGYWAEFRSKLGESEAYPNEAAKNYVGRSLSELAARGVEDHLFDAVCIDEAQDFDLDWWRLIQMAVPEHGKALIAADRTQSLYHHIIGIRRQAWTDKEMDGTGFSGKWVDLKESYRLPRVVADMLTAFVIDFLPTADSLPPQQSKDHQPELFSCSMRWDDVDEQDLVGAVADRLASVLQDGETSPADCSVLFSNHSRGMRFAEEWAKRAGQVAELTHVFHPDRDISRSLKFNFWPGDGAVKASTIHSFKGWEARVVIVGIEPLSGDEGTAFHDAQLASVYVALSRVSRSDLGSHLIVVNAEPHLRAFGSKHFQGRSASMNSPSLRT